MKSVYVTADKLAAYLDVSTTTIRLWVSTRKIPEAAYIKIGNTYRFHLRAVDDALRNFEQRKGMSIKQRDELAQKLIEGLDVTEFQTAPRGVSPEELSKADAELESKVQGIPHVNTDPEIDDALSSILDEHDQ